MNKYLALAALGPNSPTVIQDIAHAVLDSGCNIIESRVARLSSEVTINMLVTGNWSTIARLEQGLPVLGQRLGVEILAHAATDGTAQNDLLPYAIDLISMDQPGIVFRLVRFLAQRQIRINDLSSSSYVAQTTGATMVSLHMSVAVPNNLHIATLRDDFMLLCDELNLDAVLEPMKG